MKKFLIYLVVILVAVSVGFTVFYLVRDNETISISTSNIYMSKGETIDDLEILYENKKAFSDYEVFSSNDNIASYDKETGQLKANSGGIATITFRTENEKFRNLSCQVYVGDGSITSPYYIRNASDLRAIGRVDEGQSVPKYGLDKCYKVINNINLAEGYTSTGYWIPIGIDNSNGFTGNFDGNGYTISNININKQEYINAVKDLVDFKGEILNYSSYTDAGLFSKIGQNGRICNLKIENINVSGSYQNGTTLGNVGAVAGENQGTIERVEVISGNINVSGTTTIGGIVGANNTTELSRSYKDENNKTVNEYLRYTARIDRAVANINIGIQKDYAEGAIAGASGIVGGIAGKNDGGIVIYSYSKGEVHLNENTTNYGGIVGYNVYKTFSVKNDNYLYEYSGAHIKDCYTLIKLRKVNAVAGTTNVGGVVGYNKDRAALDLGANAIEGAETPSFVNKIIGNYYLIENLNFTEEDHIPDVTTDKTFIGCGKYQNDGQNVTYADAKYSIEGKNSVQLKLQETYVSHEKTERIKNGDEYEVETEEIMWKFDIIWFFTDGVNDGYPTLTFANVDVSDDLFDISDGITLDDPFDLSNIKLDGSYVLTNDIVFDDDDVWTPIGTIENPFVGTLKAGAYYTTAGEKEYYKIYNIKTSESTNLDDINREDLVYAGVFGVTNGSKGGSIENLTLVNPTFANARVVGGIVATNGYEDSVKGKPVTVSGLKIDNCHIQGGVLRATEKVGGIAGENFGSVAFCSVSDSKNEDYEVVRKTQVLLYGDSTGYAGGIVGFNYPDSTVTNSRILEHTSVYASGASTATFSVYVGGIAGANEGKIEGCLVLNTEGITIDTLAGYVGGVAGVNYKTISQVVVSASINATTSKSNTYAGGVTGAILQQASVSTANIKSATVKGYYAGGVAGYVNYSKPNYKYDLTVDKNFNYTLSDDAPVTISLCAIANNVSVTGERVGGLVGTIDNGLIKNCYTQATLYGANTSSVKGGFAADLNFNKNSKEVGIIINCYTYCTFSGSGSNYSITQKEILQDPLIDSGSLPKDLQRNAGYCFNYAYVKKDGVTDPVYKDVLTNWVGGVLDFFGANNDMTDKNRVDSVSSLHGKATHLVNRKFDFDNIWKSNDAGLPTLRSCDGLQSSLENKYARQVTVTYTSSNITVTKNGSKVNSGDKLTKGDILTITYKTTEKYTLDYIKVGDTKYGVAGSMEGTFTVEVGEANITIEYKEKLTYYDVEITEPQNGTVSVGGLSYIKAGETVTLYVVPAENFVVGEIKIIKVSDNSEILAVDNKFTMPESKITITVTFVQTYAINISSDAVAVKGETAVTNETRLVAGDKITITANDKTGYVFKQFVIKNADNTETTVTDKEFEFEMPAQDVEIIVAYLRYGVVTKPANVTILKGTEEITDNTVLEETEVTIQISPETNFIVDTLTVKTATGTVVVTNNTFKMPNEDVEIIVTYKQTYALTIPTEVTVTKGATTLTSADRVVAGDELIITFTESSSYKVIVNGSEVTNGQTITVGEADVVIVVEQVNP